MHFQYIAPSTIEETISLLGDNHKKAKILAGGTDLLLKLQRKAVEAEYVLDIQNIAELVYIEYEKNNGLRIGAGTTLREIEKSPIIQERYPVISDSAKQIASVAIRNVATLGGNLCNASPSADMAPALLCLTARTKIRGINGTRIIPITDFFSGPGQSVLEPGELLVEVQLPPMPEKSAITYLKHTTRGSVDLAMVGVAVMITREDSICREIRIGLGAVAPTPRRAKMAEALLRGKHLDSALIERAASTASDESRPISDVRASEAYRKEMVKVLTRRAIQDTLAKLNEASSNL